MATKTKAVVKEHAYQKTVEDKPDIHDELLKAFDRQEECKFDIATLIHQAYTEPLDSGKFLHEERGFTSFKDYFTANFGIEYRMAMYYNQIGEVLKKTGVEKEKIAKVGWSKFREICTLFYDGMTGAELEKILSAVEKLTVREVKDYVETRKTEKHGGQEQKKVSVKLTFYEDQIPIYDEARKIVQEETGIEDPAMQMEFICHHYIATHDVADTQKIQKKLHKQEEGKKEVAKGERRKERADKGKAVATKKTKKETKKPTKKKDK